MFSEEGCFHQALKEIAMEAGEKEQWGCVWRGQLVLPEKDSPEDRDWRREHLRGVKWAVTASFVPPEEDGGKGPGHGWDVARRFGNPMWS